MAAVISFGLFPTLFYPWLAVLINLIYFKYLVEHRCHIFLFVFWERFQKLRIYGYHFDS